MYRASLNMLVSTHSRPKAAAERLVALAPKTTFQHTAARRRLGLQLYNRALGYGFNTQPPEGGWDVTWGFRTDKRLFQHTAARRRLEKNKYGR